MLTLKLILGLTIVLWGADLLINSAIIIGRKYKVSELLIGIVVIGFGTSLCELLVSIDAVLKNAPELSLGNIIGSNVANILLVLGIAGMVKNINIPSISKFDNYFHFLITVTFILIFNFYSLNFYTGIIFIFVFFLYLFTVIKKMDKSSPDQIEKYDGLISKRIFASPTLIGVPIIIISILITFYGADLAVISAIEISLLFGISESVIGLTVVAIGTSLPEIAAGITAARKMRPNLIFGNIIGSNLYNILLILGFSSLFENFSYNKNSVMHEAIFLILSTTILLLIINYKKAIIRVESFVLLFLYLLYLFHIYQKNFLL